MAASNKSCILRLMADYKAISEDPPSVSCPSPSKHALTKLTTNSFKFILFVSLAPLHNRAVMPLLRQRTTCWSGMLL